jgi:hypothetical protein
MKPQIFATRFNRRPQYGVARPAHRLRPPNLPFRDTASLAPDLDAACWIETAGRGAVEISSIADHCGDDE